jgi:prepilin-type N-terminal cleavage/methylation domain-containing protein/prepilin-type processing-associated H-X9-DG protein
MRRRAGFTLIELLVVIAIIGILAAMLFPVFARARESARKTQCLANVKNLAMGLQIYLTDYDRFPPGEHDAAVKDWYVNVRGQSCVCEARLKDTNPYLKWPVILDEYIKSRDVWKCPSARYTTGLTILGGSDWFQRLVDNWDVCPHPTPGAGLFPPGWGGAVTDTLTQGWDGCADGGVNGAFAQNYGQTRDSVDKSTSAINDPSKYVAIAEAGVVLTVDRTSWVAYPDICRIDGVACSSTCGADWAGCSWSQSCGAPLGAAQYATDVQYRKTHAWPRHLGGSNIGFSDGHAKWFSSEAILFGGADGSGYGLADPMFEGLVTCFTPATKPKN